jgi:hypothetical protein
VGWCSQQASFVGVDDGLGTVAEAELAVDLRHVGLDGGLGQVLPHRDLALERPWAMSSSTFRSRTVPWCSGLDPGEASTSWRRKRSIRRRVMRREHGVAPGNGPDGVHELLGRGVIEDKAAGACL